MKLWKVTILVEYENCSKVIKFKEEELKGDFKYDRITKTYTEEKTNLLNRKDYDRKILIRKLGDLSNWHLMGVFEEKPTNLLRKELTLKLLEKIIEEKENTISEYNKTISLLNRELNEVSNIENMGSSISS